MKVSETFRSKFLKASDLKGRTLPVEISSVEREEVGKDQELKWVLYFRNKERALVLNHVNAMTLAKGLGDDSKDWPGNTVELYSELVFFGGDQVHGLRVRVPREPPAPSEAYQAKRPSAPVTAGAEDLDDDINF